MAVDVIRERRSLMDEMAVDLPEGSHGSVSVKRFEVRRDSIENLRQALVGRSCRPGQYTMLTRNGSLWMSDTTAERSDHLTPAWAIERHGGRVLIGGLGLGMILRVALLTPTVEHVDVVEIDPDVVALVGPHYEAMATERGVSLTIHTADMYAIKWTPNTRWNVAWFDIWPDLCTDDLAEMARLRRSYGRRTDWCECWGRTHLVAERRRERSSPWGRW